MLFAGMRTVVIATLLLGAMALGESQVAAESLRFQAEPVQRVYDLAGVLSPEDKARLERRAEIISDQAGVPTVIYVQRGPVDEEITLSESGRVASILDAENGLVVIVTISSSSPRFGTVAFFVGQDLDEGGRLTVERLHEIYEEEMVRHLQVGRWVDGVNLGLAQVAYTLIFEIFPAPPRSSAQQTIADITRLPLNALAILAVAAAGGLWLRTWRSRAQTGAAGLAGREFDSLDDLPPALAGALVSGRLTGALPVATMLDLARQEAIAIEPVGRKQVQVRLRRDGGLKLPHEIALWEGLAALANDDGIVSRGDLQRLIGYWQPFEQALRSELEAEGWFHPSAGSRRKSLQVAGGALLIGAVVVLLFSIAGRESWGFLGVGVLLGAGVGSLAYRYHYRATTAEGDDLGRTFQAYFAEVLAAAQVKDASRWPDMLPYAVALGAIPPMDRVVPGEESYPARMDRRDAAPVAAFLVMMSGGRAV